MSLQFAFDYFHLTALILTILPPKVIGLASSLTIVAYLVSDKPTNTPNYFSCILISVSYHFSCLSDVFCLEYRSSIKMFHQT